MKTNISYFKKTAHYAVLTAFMGALISGPATAQIDEIIVTSQKRSEALSVQDIPSSITAVAGDLMDDIQSVDLTDVGRLAPNATLHPSATFASTPNFLIRGLGVSGTTRSLDPTVGLLLMAFI